MDMFGWDVVSTLNAEVINRDLEANSDFWSDGFSYVASDGSSITGQFLPWQIFPGGSGGHLRFIAPIQSGTMSFTLFGEHYDEEILPIVIEFDCTLKFTTKSDKNVMLLSFDFRTFSPLNIPGYSVRDSDGQLVIINSDLCNAYPENDKSIPSLYAAYIAEMLIEKQLYLYPIATVYFNIPTDNPDAWLNCSSPKYCYSETDTLNGWAGFLAIMGILDQNPTPPDIDKLNLAFDSALTKTNAAFAIAEWAFLKNILLPGMPYLFSGSNISQFKVENGEIKNNGLVMLAASTSPPPVPGGRFKLLYNKSTGDYPDRHSDIYDIPYFYLLTVRVEGSIIILAESEGEEQTLHLCALNPFQNTIFYGDISFTLAGQYSVDLAEPSYTPQLFLSALIKPTFNYVVSDSGHSGGCIDDLNNRLENYGEDLKARMWLFSGYDVLFNAFPIEMTSSIFYTDCELNEDFVLRG